MRVKPIADRLWAKTAKRGPDECWEWLGWKHPFGHGQIGRGRKSDGLTYTHIAAWEVTHGPVPKGLCVCHRCDNPSCVNPAHLFLGDHATNMRDMIAKRRNSFGERHAKKLLEAQVLEIRQALAAGETQQALADRFNVSRSMIGQLGRFGRWKQSAAPDDLQDTLLARPMPGASEVCGNGHVYADVGFYRDKNGGRNCKACHSDRIAKYMANGGAEKKRASSRQRLRKSREDCR